MNINTLLEVLKGYGIIAIAAGIICGYITSSLSGKNIIGVIAGLIITILLLILPYTSSPVCEDCGNVMKYGDNYCTVCGNFQKNGDIFGNMKCEMCGKKTPINSTICSHCGAKIG